MYSLSSSHSEKELVSRFNYYNKFLQADEPISKCYTLMHLVCHQCGNSLSSRKKSPSALL
jgi:hypothetical protein